MIIIPPRRLVWLLWMLLFAFCCRVLGQALVAFLHVMWLPPMEAWYSGLMPYPLLLPTQLLIIAVYAKVCWDFRGLYPEARWFGGTIPIFFHWVLASFIIAFGLCHRDRLMTRSHPS
jgi:hypothetical protein